jgi:hypothetical protein
VTLIAHDEPPVDSRANAICCGVVCQFATFHDALAADHRDAEGDGSPSVSALIVMFDGFAFGFGPGRPNSGHRKPAICKRNCPIN